MDRILRKGNENRQIWLTALLSVLLLTLVACPGASANEEGADEEGYVRNVKDTPSLAEMVS